MKKRILSILLAVLMLLSALPLGMVDTAYAAETSGVAAQSYYVAGGQCGDDLTWTLDSSGTLTISGTGPMYNYSLWDNPWCDIALRSSGISTRVVNAVVSSGVTALGERALADCGSMVSVSLPETLLTVGESCFMSSDALRSITIPNSVRSIGLGAFTACKNLSRVTLGRGLQRIGGQAFRECSSLSSIVIPDGVKKIEYLTFSDCANLMEITIPHTVTVIENHAFANCNILSRVTFTGTRAQWNAIDMGDDNDPLLSANITFAGSGPAAPTVTGGNDAQGRPTLKWNAVTGAAKYEVYRARSKDGDYIKYSTVTGTSYTNISYIENGNTYYYKVRALDANGTAGAWSSVVSVTYKQTLPAPTVTGGNDAQGRPTLRWNAVSGAAKYEVYRARSMNGDYIKYSTVTGTSYTNISYIENGNTYYYKVRALDANGMAGAWSSIVSVTYKQTLSAPTVTGGNDAQGRPTLKWNAVSGAAKYEVYRARSKNGDYIKYSTVTGTSYTNTGYIENGNTYYYKVRALDASGTAGAWSSIVSVTYRAASTGTLPAPTVTGGNDAQGRPTLTWNAVTGAAKYEVYRARSQSGDYIKYSTVTGTSYTNTSYIEDGNTYYYKVRALDANGTAGAWGSIVSVTYRAASTGTLSAPTVTGGNDAQGRPTLKWNAVTGAAKYEVYRARSLNGDYIKYSTVTGTSYTNTSYIENGNTYYYKVRALKSDGTAGAWSSIVSVTYRAASTGTLPAPAVTGGNDSQGRPTLKWKAVSGAAKYEIYRSYSRDGSYSKYSTQTSTAYTNSSYLTSGTTYYYKVRALDANGNAGPYSAVVSVTCRLKLSAPSVTGGKDSQGRPTLKWNAVTGAAKYEVYRSTSRSGTYTKYSTQTSTSYTNSSYLTSGTTYYYKVRALGSDGSYGPYSSVVSVTYRATSSAVPAEVTMGKATAQGSYITVTWDKAANAASYRVYRRVNNSSDWNVVASSVSGTSYTDWNVEPGVRYTYTVRGVAADGQTLSKTYNKTGVTAFATINSNNVASDSLLLKPSVNIPSSLTRMNWDYIGLYYYHGQTINAGLDDFGGMLRLLFNSDGTVYLVSGNGTSRGVYYANDSVISIMFPDDETPQVYMVTFMRTEKYTYLHLMPDASGREALVFSAGSYR
ncbi:MAG: leucine-rich repeat protein [Oscillospiraceae bacterium]